MANVDADLHELVELVDAQLKLSASERVALLLGERWPTCVRALRAAAGVSDLAAVIGPVGVALHGGPQQPGDGRVDLLCAPDAQDAVAHALIDAGARVGDLWRAGRAASAETRLHLSVDGAHLTLRTRAAGVSDPAAVVATAVLVDVAGGVVRVATVGDLAAIVAASPWGQDAPYRSGLRALLGHQALRDAAAA